jgi:3-carboxy-cis,cis-muconate cycloisomerase
MVFPPADSRLLSALFNDPELAALFTDEALVRQMLAVEAALATVEGRLGVIPEAEAAQIASAAATLRVNIPEMQAGMEKAGVPVIELVRQLRARAGDKAADYVHWGATTQDIVDTAVILQARVALILLEDRLNQIVDSLAQMADRHRHTLMAGRTHSQQALPIPFGLKAANWLAPLLRHRRRLAELRPRLLVVQFGGAAGTLAALGDHGTAVRQALAQELQLGVPPTPWHTQRDNVAECASWLSLLSGSLAKMAQDIILMAQTEVGEVRESSDPARGGSSTMPQKANPIISETIIAAARTNASLLANMHQAQIQEHERGTHGWQMEWLSLPQMFALTGGILNKSLFLSRNLVVEETKMQANVAASQGLMMAEAISFALAESLGRREAKRLVGEACHIAVAQNRHLIEIVREMTTAPVDWEALQDESAYFGSSNTLIDRVLLEANEAA